MIWFYQPCSAHFYPFFTLNNSNLSGYLRIVRSPDPEWYLCWGGGLLVVFRPCILVMDSLKLSYHENVCRLLREWVSAALQLQAECRRLFSHVKVKQCLQLPAGGVGGSEEDASSLHVRHHEELLLQSSSAGQQQRLWTLPAAVCGELLAGDHTLILPQKKEKTRDRKKWSEKTMKNKTKPND